ncbi:MAG: dienelactone hydrolase family protein [Acidobacteria bacterium]|nr:dienelactone hydrolase family protein [Acidobacteriota bacterium]
MIREAPDGRGGAVSVAIHEPAGGPPAGPALLLTHGAGGNRDTPGLVSLAESLAGRKIRTLRFNLPAAEAGRRRPDSPARATACIAAVAHWAAREHAGSLFVGGRSFGGRMASLLLADSAAEARSLVAGAVLLAYPLRPPGKPAVPPERVEHLGRIGLPMLFVSGDRDPFAPPELLNPAVAAAGSEVRWIAGGDHGFRVPKAVLTATGRTAAEVRNEIAEAVAAFIAATAAGSPTRVG